MAENFFNQTEGSGKKLHTFNKTIGANDVHDEVVLQGLPYLASYSAIGVAQAITTSSDHCFQLMAGSSLNVYVTRIYATQNANAGAAALTAFELMRLSTAGTGGGAVTPSPFDTTDAASGAAAMTRPTTPGTVGTRLWYRTAIIRGATPATTELPIFDVSFGPPQLTKPLRIAAGTTNGVTIRVVTGVATATITFGFEFFEANF